MKRKIKKILINLFTPIAVKLGFQQPNQSIQDNSSLGKNELLKTFFKVALASGFEPKHIVDVGANHGTWTKEALKYFPKAYYTLIEPQEWLKTSIQDLLDSNSKIEFHAAGAGEKTGTFEFTLVDRDDSCNFRISKEEAAEKGLKQIEVPVITLDELIAAQKNKPFPDLVKIDAEGLDLEVLAGATSLIGKTEVFMVEAAIGCKSMNNTLLKMTTTMDQNGYKLFDITDLNRPFPHEVLWLVELVFVKKKGLLDSFNFEV